MTGWSYDGVGNLLNSGDHTYTYDAEGRVVSLDSSSIQNMYDAFGRLMEQNRAGTYTQVLYSPSGQKFAYMNGSTVKKYVVPLAGGLQAVYNGSGLQYYRHADWLGSNRFSATPAGTMYFDQAYAPFGENYAGRGTVDRSFTRQNEDTVANYLDFPFRMYTSTQSRWMVPDPAGLAAVDITNPQTWNRYAYVGNNPLNARDPYGLFIQACFSLDGNCSWGLGGGDMGSPGYYGGAPQYTLDGLPISGPISTTGFGGNSIGLCPSDQPNCVIDANNQAYRNVWVPDPNGEPTGSWQQVPIGSASNVVFGSQNCDLTPITCMMNSHSFPSQVQPQKPDCTKGPCIKGPEPVKIGPQPKPFVPSAWSCAFSPADSGVPEVPGDPRVDSGVPGNPQMDFLSMIVDYVASAANCWSHWF